MSSMISERLPFADLEMTVRGTTQQYAIDLRFRRPDSQMDSELASAIPLHIEMSDFLEQSLNHERYSSMLTAAVFCDQRMREAWARVRGFIEGTGQALRFRLRIEPEAQDLQAIHWELLGDPEYGAPLCRDQQIFFSRYCDSGSLARVSEPPAFDQARILAVMANPTDLARYQMPEINVGAELSRIERILNGAPITTLVRHETAVAPTHDNLRMALNQGCHILYLVCHGLFHSESPVLWLERPDGTSARVFGDDLVEDVRELAAERRPALIVLVSCQSAGSGVAAERVLAALGPQLAAAGAGAVIGMRGDVSFMAAEQIVTRLFTHLRACGEIDRALNRTRVELGNAHEWWAPVLFQRVRDGLIFHPSEAPQRSTDYNEALQLYQQQVVATYKLLPLRGLSLDDSSLDIPLEEIFVRLRLIKYEGARIRSPYHSAPKRYSRPEPLPNTQEIQLDDALRSQLLIVGDPGSGKSTLLRWLAVTFAQGRQREQNRIGPLADLERIPILVELGRINFEEGPLDWREILPRYITQQVAFRNIPPTAIGRAIDDGRCILLFDGLDEIANRELRGDLVKSLADFSRLASPNRVVIGSRMAGVRDHRTVLQEQEFRSCEILPFDDRDVQRFFHYWYVQRERHDLDVAYTKADALYEQLQQSEPTRRLAQNPLLCTLICIIWEREAALPKHRVNLYDTCCRLLIDTWAQEQYTRPGVSALNKQIAEYGIETHLKLLAPLAYTIHESGEREVGQAQLIEPLAQALHKEKVCPDEESALIEARAYLKALTFRSGLLQAPNEEQYGFPHHTFQEYLAARHMAAFSDKQLVELMVERLYKSWWREIHLLLIGHLGRDDPQHGDREGVSRAGMLIDLILDLGRLPRKRDPYETWPWLLLRPLAYLVMLVAVVIGGILVWQFAGSDIVAWISQWQGPAAAALASVALAVMQWLSRVFFYFWPASLVLVVVLIVRFTFGFVRWRRTAEERRLKRYKGFRLSEKEDEAQVMISVLQREYELVALAGREFNVDVLPPKQRERLSIASAWLLRRMINRRLCATANQGLISVACELLLPVDGDPLRAQLTNPFLLSLDVDINRPQGRLTRPSGLSNLVYTLLILNEIGDVGWPTLRSLLRLWPAIRDKERKEERSPETYRDEEPTIGDETRERHVPSSRKYGLAITDYSRRGFPRNWLKEPDTVMSMLYRLLAREYRIWHYERQIWKLITGLPRVWWFGDTLRKEYRRLRRDRLNQFIHVIAGFGIAAPGAFLPEIIKLLVDISNELVEYDDDETTINMAISALRCCPQPDDLIVNRLIEDLQARALHLEGLDDAASAAHDLITQQVQPMLTDDGVELSSNYSRTILFDVPAEPTDEGLRILISTVEDPHPGISSMVYHTLATLNMSEADLNSTLNTLFEPLDAAGYAERITRYRRFNHGGMANLESVLAAAIEQDDNPALPPDLLDTINGVPLSPHQEDLIIQALTSGSQAARTLALAILRQQSEPSPNLVTALTEALNDRRWWVRQSVITGLASVRFPTAALIDALRTSLRDQRIEVREAVTTTLGELCPRSLEAVLSLTDILTTGDSDMRVIAVRALGQLSQSTATVIQALATKLDDPVPNVRAAAAASLARLSHRDDAITLRLVRLLQEGGAGRRGVRIAAADALGRLGNDKRALTALQKALGDPLPPVRIAAARSLATLKASGKGVTEALVRLLEDSNHSVQGAALAALGRLGEIDMTAVEALIKIVNKKKNPSHGEVDKKNDPPHGGAIKALGRLSESGGSNTNLRSKLFEVLCRSLDDPTVAYDAASSLRNFSQEITEEPLLRRAIYIYWISSLWRSDSFALINFLRKILEDRPLPIDEYNRDRILRTRATLK